MHSLHELNAKFPVRRTDAQKAEFRAFVMEYAAECGLMASVQTSADGKNENIVVGNPESAKTVLTAHYDTPARALVPNLMFPNSWIYLLYQCLIIGTLLVVSFIPAWLIGMTIFHNAALYVALYYVFYYIPFIPMFFWGINPHNINDNTSGVAVLLSIMDEMDKAMAGRVAFLFFDNEEKGKKGSKAYFKDNASFMQEKLVINFDCVGNGEHIVFFAKPDAEQKREYQALQASFVSNDSYFVQFRSLRGLGFNSDYKNFPCGVGCGACKRTEKGLLYTPYIHTIRDTVASEENIVYLTDGALQWITTLCNE